MQSLEEALVDAFIVPAKRERYKSLLANRQRRAKFLDVLNHCNDLNPRYAAEIQSQADVVALLRSRALSANVGETPAHPSITVGRWKVNTDDREEEDGLGRAPRPRDRG